jgi:hypothetical protein
MDGEVKVRTWNQPGKPPIPPWTAAVPRRYRVGYKRKQRTRRLIAILKEKALGLRKQRRARLTTSTSDGGLVFEWVFENEAPRP